MHSHVLIGAIQGREGIFSHGGDRAVGMHVTVETRLWHEHSMHLGVRHHIMSLARSTGLSTWFFMTNMIHVYMRMLCKIPFNQKFLSCASSLGTCTEAACKISNHCSLNLT